MITLEGIRQIRIILTRVFFCELTRGWCRLVLISSAHQTDLMREGNRAFLVCGDVYRRDEIDSTHYPVFHQVEGVKIFDSEYLKRHAGEDEASHEKFIEKDMKMTLEGLVKHLFGQEGATQWVDGYFPFTHPSWELEMSFQDKWLEVLGCGLVHRDILRNCNLGGSFVLL